MVFNVHVYQKAVDILTTARSEFSHLRRAAVGDDYSLCGGSEVSHGREHDGERELGCVHSDQI